MIITQYIVHCSLYGQIVLCIVLIILFQEGMQLIIMYGQINMNQLMLTMLCSMQHAVLHLYIGHKNTS